MSAGVLQAIFEKSMPVPEAGCWLWMGHCSGRYGRMRVGGNKAEGAHRLSWRLHRGEIPAGMLVCHKCDTPLCVNPDHLFIGTDADNARDRDSKGRQVAGRAGAKNPHRQPFALSRTNEQWAVWLAAMNCRLIDIARHFGVSQGTISHAIGRSRARAAGGQQA